MEHTPNYGMSYKLVQRRKSTFSKDGKKSEAFIPLNIIMIHT